MLRECPRTGIVGRIRAVLLLLEASHVLWSEGAARAISIYVDALRWAADVPELEATVHLRIAYVADHDLALARTHARAAVDLVDGVAGAEELLASALLLSAELRLLTGDGYDAAAVVHGLARRSMPGLSPANEAGSSMRRPTTSPKREWSWRRSGVTTRVEVVSAAHRSCSPTSSNYAAGSATLRPHEPTPTRLGRCSRGQGGHSTRKLPPCSHQRSSPSTREISLARLSWAWTRCASRRASVPVRRPTALVSCIVASH
jgi:hypothetical protein